MTDALRADAILQKACDDNATFPSPILACHTLLQQKQNFVVQKRVQTRCKLRMSYGSSADGARCSMPLFDAIKQLHAQQGCRQQAYLKSSARHAGRP